MGTLPAIGSTSLRLPRSTWVLLAAWLLLAALSGLFGAGPAHAQAADTVPAVANADAMNSLLGRIAAPAGFAVAAPRLTVEHALLLDSDRARFGHAGLDAYGRPLVELGGATYRWWVTRGATQFGVGFGTFGYLLSPPDSPNVQPYTHTGSVLSLGWRHQMADQSTVFADASGARRFNADTLDRVSTKVGLEWKGRTNKFGIDGVSRSLALQLDSGYRMSLRVRKNGVGVYVKGQF